VCLLCSNLREKLGELIFIVIVINLGMKGLTEHRTWSIEMCDFWWLCTTF